MTEEVAMCRGDRLIADFVAGTSVQPVLPRELEEHLTTTVDGLWVVWAHKLARPMGDLFVPLSGGSGYPADARATCRFRGLRGAHDAPDPGCTCGFHALSSRRLPGLYVGGPPCPTGWQESRASAAIPTILTVAPLSSAPPRLVIRGRCG